MPPISTLPDLPEDILLHLLTFLPLADHVTLCLVSRSLNALSYKRSMWIQVLSNERLHRPIACTAHEDLSTLDLVALRRIALHTLRLDRNWALPEPRVMGVVKAVTLNTGTHTGGQGVPHTLDLIFQVPATELYVFHSRRTGDIAAWDAGRGCQVAPPVYVGRRVMDVSAGQESRGRFYMGLLATDNPNNEWSDDIRIAVVYLEYGADDVRLSTTFPHQLSAGLAHWAIFMTKDYVGVLECSPVVNNEEFVKVVAINLATERTTLITTDIPQNFGLGTDAHSGTSTVDGDLFIIAEDDKLARIFRIHKAHLPHDGNLDAAPKSTLKCNAAALSIPRAPYPTAELEQYGNVVELVSQGALSSNDFYRMPAVTLHAVRRPVSAENGLPGFFLGYMESRMRIRFWNAASLSGTDPPPPPCVIEVTGDLQDSPDASWRLMLLAHSGRHVLLVINHGGAGSSIALQLISVHPETGTCTAHELAVPPFVQLGYVYGLSMDDHMGIITLLDARGYMFTIPYA